MQGGELHRPSTRPSSSNMLIVASPRPCPRSRPCGFWMVSQEKGADFAMALNFWVVFGGCCLLSASPTWENAGVLRCFGPVRPAKPPRSCRRGLLVLKVAHLNTCSSPVGAGRRYCDY